MRYSVYEYPDGAEPRPVGSFEIGEVLGCYEDGSDPDDRSVTHQELYRTGDGRWVLNSWTSAQAEAGDGYGLGGGGTCRYVTLAEARAWLLKHGHDDVVAKDAPAEHAWAADEEWQ